MQGTVVTAVHSHLARVSRVSTNMMCWLAVLVIAAASLAVGLVVSGQDLGSPAVVVGLALVAAIAELSRVRLSNETEESISLVPTIFAAVLFGPLASMLVAAVSYAPHFRRPYMKWVSYTSSRSITGALAGLTAARAIVTTDNRLAAIAIATTAGTVVAQLLDAAFASAVAKLRGNSVRELLSSIGAPIAGAVPLYSPVVAVLAFVYESVSPWTLILFFVPALAAQRLFGLYQDQRRR
jgi:uncharacterized membrane protein